MAPHLHHHHSSPTSTLTPAASPKGQQYALTLDLARRLGLFDSKYPAQLKGGINRGGGGGEQAAAGGGQAGMDWNELLRKFKKHNPNRSLTAQTALVDQIIHSLLFTHASPPLPSQSSSSLPSLPPLIPPSHRPQLLTALESLQSQLSNGGTRHEVENARIVLGFGSYVVGQFEGSLRALDNDGTVAEGGVEEAYDWTLRVLGNAVKGFSIEQLGRPLQEARESYRLALRAYEQAIEHLSKGGGKEGTRDDVSLHRIGETVLFRLCAIDNSISSPQIAYTSHLSYIRHSTSSPHPYPSSHALLIHQQFRQLSHQTQNYSNSSFANQAEESILRNNTTLPRAGEVNIEYLRFLDGANEGWKRGGCRKQDSNQVIEIMYNALSHTFQSQRLLRYLVRALTVAERYEEAGKALRLYFELWEKARETDAKGVAREMKSLRRKAGVEESTDRLREREGTTEWVKVGGEEKGGEFGQEKMSGGEEEDGHDMDSDREFIELGSFGVRLLCRYLGDPGEGLRLSRKMKEVFEEGKEVGLKEDKRLNALVELAMGISLGALAARDANPELRPEQHASSLSHLESAATLHPTFHTLYSLSYALSELRQISRALEVAREAVRLNKRSKLGWHLLGLLCTARKDMQGALQVFETALDTESEEEEGERGGEEDALAKLEGKTDERSRRREEELEERWNYPVNETEVLAREVQIRLSKNTVIEYLEGPAAALEDQKEILSWFAVAYKPIAESLAAATPPPSAQVQSTMNSTPTTTEGANLSKRKSLIGRRVSLRSKRESSLPPPIGTAHLSPPPGLSPSSITSTPYASASPTPQNRSVVDLSTTSNLDRSKPDLDSNPLATRLLVEVWLASAASFRRAGKLEESKGAVWEAEQLDQDQPEVWSALASIHMLKGETKLARSSLQRAFSYSIDHLPSLILFSRIYLTPLITPTDTSYITKQLPFAEALLDTLTKKKGWDSPEAWFELSRCYQLTGRREKEKECLVWALQLEETRAVREREKSLERIL